MNDSKVIVPYFDRQYIIRAEMVEALRDYVEKRIPLGGFLRAVVTNNFKEACGRADSQNIFNLPAFATYVYNEMPAPSQGSPEAYRAWLSKKDDSHES